MLVRFAGGAVRWPSLAHTRRFGLNPLPTPSLDRRVPFCFERRDRRFRWDDGVPRERVPSAKEIPLGFGE